MKVNSYFLIWLLLGGLLASGYRFITAQNFPIPAGWPEPVFDFTRDSFAASKVQLGRYLFYESVLSADSSLSCASCHSSYNAFAHTDHALSHGIRDIIGRRNAPALMNLAWQPVFMWDGAVKGLKQQATVPITHSGEMGNHVDTVLKRLNNMMLYRQLTSAAYGDSLLDASELMGALAQFQVSLISCQSKYDSVKRGEAVFTYQEEMGYQVFRQTCSSCHKEPLFTDHSFQFNGLPPRKPFNDSGRYQVTHQPNDIFRFKVPTLRNLRYTYPYMHDGRFNQLSEVMRHYRSRFPSISDNQSVDLVAFLQTLSDPSFVFQPAFRDPSYSR